MEPTPDVPDPTPRRRPVHRPPSGVRRRGFTIIELVAVLTILLVLLGIVAPRLLATNASVAVTNGAARVSASTVRARAAATRYGTTAYLVLDVAADQIRVEVDTAVDGGQPPVAVHVLDLWRELRVDLRASAPVVCYDPRGTTLMAAGCPAAAVTAWVERGAELDSVVIGATGRVMP